MSLLNASTDWPPRSSGPTKDFMTKEEVLAYLKEKGLTLEDVIVPRRTPPWYKRPSTWIVLAILIIGALALSLGAIAVSASCTGLPNTLFFLQKMAQTIGKPGGISLIVGGVFLILGGTYLATNYFSPPKYQNPLTSDTSFN